jgi:hypothetical protein
LDWFDPVTKIPGLYLTGEAAAFGGFYGNNNIYLAYVKHTFKFTR